MAQSSQTVNYQETFFPSSNLQMAINVHKYIFPASSNHKQNTAVKYITQIKNTIALESKSLKHM